MAVNLQLRVPGRRRIGREEGMHKAITVKERVKMTTCKCFFLAEIKWGRRGRLQKREGGMKYDRRNRQVISCYTQVTSLMSSSCFKHVLLRL